MCFMLAIRIGGSFPERTSPAAEDADYEMARSRDNRTDGEKTDNGETRHATWVIQQRIHSDSP